MTSPAPTALQADRRLLAGLVESGRRLQLARPPGPTTVVVRGDLRSRTGYGKAARALAALLAERFEVLGSDIHYNPHDAAEEFGHTIVSDAEMHRRALQSPGDLIVLHYTPPDRFVRVEGALNIGCFYWETGLLPRRAGWPDLLSMTDRMWAPTTFVREVLTGAGYAGPISIVTWPHDFDKPDPPADRAVTGKLRVWSLNRLHENGAARTTLEQVRERASVLFLAVQSLAPRKGLPMLLAAWRDFVRSTPSEPWLLLKLRFIHSQRSAASPHEHLSTLLTETGFKSGDPVRIALLSDELTDLEMHSLYGTSDAFVTATYGEGFGGPVVEALAAHRAVVAPRHTGLADLLAPDYPFLADSEELALPLSGSLGVYPHASTWRLTSKASLQAALADCAEAGPEGRAAAAAAARDHAARFCSVPAVCAQLRSALGDAGVAT